MDNKRMISILVVDDNFRFALFLWRYLSRSIGFGIGRQMATRSHESFSDSTHFFEWGDIQDIQDPAMLFTVRWVSADSKWKDKLHGLKQVDVALLDIVGRDGYDPEAVARELAVRFPALPHERIYRVSSYESGRRGGAAEVSAKSLALFRKIQLEFPAQLSHTSAIGPRTICTKRTTHVLVTGAGFEIPHPYGGPGIPATAQILASMGVISEQKGDGSSWHVSFETATSSGFPVPAGETWNGELQETIGRFACDHDLDSYWNYLLSQETDRQLRGSGGEKALTVQERLAALVRASKLEQRLREAFRAALLKYDWGHLSQCLFASEMDWLSWLSTNYTHFADRAIADTQSRRLRDDWRIFSTPAEAQKLLEEDLDSRYGVSSDDQRPLFKLHGDIGHLHTMAIAGVDKERRSQLHFAVDRLSTIYLCAERYLEQQLEMGSQNRLIWHIVGHGMWDAILTNLISRVSTKFMYKGEVCVVVVDPRPQGPVSRLREAYPIDSDKLLRVPCGAETYMTRLVRHSDQIGDLKDLEAIMIGLEAARG